MLSVIRREVLLKYPESVLAAYANHVGEDSAELELAMHHVHSGCSKCEAYITVDVQAAGVKFTHHDIIPCDDDGNLLSMGIAT